jgi:glutathione synthase/RimK-type ligase-like ATP-grasp enzyme
VVGDQVFSVAIDSQSNPDARVDWRHATLHLRHEQVELPASVNAKLVGIIGHYGLAFGAFDLIQTPEGEIVFLELNPNGQWAWLEQLTGIPIREALIDLLAHSNLP